MIRAGHVKQQTIGEYARGTCDRQFAFCQQLLIDHNFVESPGAEPERLNPEVHTVFKELILQLQVLRRKESAFAPQDGLQLFHGL